MLKKTFAVIISAVLLAAIAIVTGLALIGGVFGDNILLNNMLNLMTIGMVVIFVTIVYLYVSNLSMIKTLQDDNEYNLGVRSAFFNMYAFQKRVEMRSRFNRIGKKAEHIIAFTFSSLVVSLVNTFRDLYGLFDVGLSKLCLEPRNMIDLYRNIIGQLFIKGYYIPHLKAHYLLHIKGKLCKYRLEFYA